MKGLKSAFKHMSRKVWPEPPKPQGILSTDLKPILEAAHHQDLKELKHFLKKYEIKQLLGVTSSMNTGCTLMHDAAKKGHLGVLELLLEYGADIHIKDNWDMTPLHVAAAEGCKESVAFLVSRGANVEAVDASGTRPLSAAAHRGHRDTVELLLGLKADIDAQDEYGLSALHEAAAHPGTLKFLLERGANPDICDNAALSPLMWICTAVDAATHRHSAAILLQHGARTDLRDKHHMTAVELAGGKGNDALVSIIEAAEEERHQNQWRLSHDMTVRRLRLKHGAHQ